MPSLRHISAMVSSPRRPAITIRSSPRQPISHDRSRSRDGRTSAELTARHGARARAVRCHRRARDSGGALFGTDGGWFSGSGIVSLICGPGDLDQAHQPDDSEGFESLEHSPVRQGTDGMAETIPRFEFRVWAARLDEPRARSRSGGRWQVSEQRGDLHRLSGDRGHQCQSAGGSD